MNDHEQAEVARTALATVRQTVEDDDRLIPSHDTRHIVGGISDMTLWRWLNDEELDFPRPVYIGRRRYWWRKKILAWLEAQPESAPHKKPPVARDAGTEGFRKLQGLRQMTPDRSPGKK